MFAPTKTVKAVLPFILILGYFGILNAQPDVVVFKAGKGDVSFPHQKHGEMPGTDCTACHHKATDGKDPQACRDCHGAKKKGDVPSAKEAMHKTCKDCHKAKKAGPKACKDCHAEKGKSPAKSREKADAVKQEPPKVPIMLPAAKGAVRFEHEEHTKEAGVACVVCHHTETEGKVASRCRDCHQKEKQEETPALKDAMHKRCIDCHKSRDGGPRKCDGCHKAEKGKQRHSEQASEKEKHGKHKRHNDNDHDKGHHNDDHGNGHHGHHDDH